MTHLARASKSAAVLAVLLVTACRAELPTPIDPTIGGRYELRSVNGRALPFTRAVESGTETTEAAFLEFAEALSFYSEFRVSLNGATESAVLSSGGIWVQYEHGLQLNYYGASLALIAQVDGDKITLRDAGDTFVFEK